MRIQQIRNATLKIEYAGQTVLLDPWLQDKGTGFSANASSLSNGVYVAKEHSILISLASGLSVQVIPIELGFVIFAEAKDAS